MMAKDGRCKFGDARGDGYVRSEGAGLIALKLLDQAVADGDRIYAVIRGSAVNNDGFSSGRMGRPSFQGHEALLRAAYKDAGVAPGTVSYVEAHGTGTRVGDPVEVSAIAAVLGENRVPGHPIRLGSVKTNFGHSEGAAGIAGLIKTALAVHRGAIPPSLHYEIPNPNIAWSDLNCEIVRSNTSWPPMGKLPIAGVNAFGISGTNAHVVLEGISVPSSAAPESTARSIHVLPISASTPLALRALAGRYAQRLSAAPHLKLASMCATAATRRTAMEYRAVVTARTLGEMAEALAGYAAGDAPVIAGAAAAKPRVAFVVPGQGAQWLGMGRELLIHEPAFRTALERCDVAISKYVDWSIVEQLRLDPESPDYRMEQIDVIQPVILAMAIAYAEWLKSLGVRPDAVLGHSMGEVGAAYLAGVLTLDQTMRIICRRSALMRGASGQGAMATLDLPMDAARERLVGRESRLSLAVSNSPRSCVIAGEPAAVNDVIAECEQEGVFARLIKVDVASHSPQMDGPAATLDTELQDLVPAMERIPIVSSVLARAAGGSEFDGSYWARNLRQPVRFAESVSCLLEEDVTIFVELSPHPILTQAIQETAQSVGREVITIECGRRDVPEQLAALTAIARIWASGGHLDWREIVGHHACVDLPLYPWQRERYWSRQAEQGPSAKPLSSNQVGVEAAQRAWLHVLKWRPIDLPDVSQASHSRPWIVVGSSALSEAVCDAFGAVGLSASAVSREHALQAIEVARPENLAGIVILGSDELTDLYAPVEILQACTRFLASDQGSGGPKSGLRRAGHNRSERKKITGAQSRVLYGD